MIQCLRLKMTFIVAIQLNDSIVITADNKHIVINDISESCEKIEKTAKIHSWNDGVITGTGESYVIHRSIELFKKLALSDITKLPQCLDISRQFRELEIGKSYFQVENTKLLCTSYSEEGAQLYKIERFDPSQPYTLTKIKPMDITIWLFSPDIDAISVDLKNLYANLKDYIAFPTQADWINHYLNYLAPIYQKQSQQDSFMSQSFDIFFQTKNEYISAHVPNTQNSVLEFKEITKNLQSI